MEFIRTRPPLKLSVHRKENRPARKVKAENEPCALIEEVWNNLPYVRHHLRGTRTYLRAVKLLHRIQSQGLAGLEISEQWKNKNKIPARVLVNPWGEEDIVQTMRILSDASSPNHWPGPLGPLRNAELAALIYNPVKMSSWFAWARKRENAPLTSEEHNRRCLLRLGEDGEKMLSIFRKRDLNFPAWAIEKTVQAYNNMCEQGLYFQLTHFVPGGVLGYLRELADWWASQSNWERIRPFSFIPPSGWAWILFMKEVFPGVDYVQS